MFQIYTDAATKGSIGKTGVGIVILHNQQQIQLSIPLNNDYNNHQGEFIAQILALEYLYQNFKISDDLILINSDSKLVVHAISKRYVNDKYLSLYNQLIKYYLDNSNIFIKWIPESQNKGADNLAKQALKKSKVKKDPNNLNY